MKQMSIFDFTEETEKRIEEKIAKRLEIGDTVVVSAVPDDYADDPETFHYLMDFKGKKGRLTQIIKGDNHVSFRVLFTNGKDGIFYEKEISKFGGDVK